VNRYEAPHEYNATRVEIEPMDFCPWRLSWACHLTLVLAMLIAALLDMGFFGRLGELTTPGFRFLISGLFLAVDLGLLVPVFVARIAMLMLFIRAITHDKRYAIAGLAELLLMGADRFIALPMR